MTTESHPDHDTTRDVEQPASDSEGRRPGVGDDERESRDQIERTGEPQRDALGNQDGAS